MLEGARSTTEEKALRAKSEKAGRLTVAERLKLLQGALGIYVFFISYGKLQERIFQFKSPKGQKFTAVWLLQAVDALANVIVGGLGRQLEGPSKGMPQQLLLYSGLCQVMSKYCFSASLAAGLSFPVATLAKSGKMIPVMIGSLFLGGARFSWDQVARAAAIVGGTSIVTLSEGGGKGNGSSKLGLLLIGLGLACDGIVGGAQKRLKVELKEKDITEKPYDLMFWTNLYMLLASLVFAGLRAELKQGLAYCRANPEILNKIIKFAACGAMGQASIFYTITNFDSVVCTAITTTRKLISVLLSVADGDKPLPPMGWFGLGLAGTGIVGQML